jgi:hypothetical protein
VVAVTLANADLMENRTELMLNGEIMFKMHKKIATVLSPPFELDEKQGAARLLDTTRKGLNLSAVREPYPPLTSYEATQAALIV